MYTCESVEALKCCIRLCIFMSRFEMTLLHPYESAEALCPRRNKVLTVAKWQVVWADSRWYGPALMSNGRDGNFKGILMDTYELVEACRCCIPSWNPHEDDRSL